MAVSCMNDVIEVSRADSGSNLRVSNGLVGETVKGVIAGLALVEGFVAENLVGTCEGISDVL